MRKNRFIQLLFALALVIALSALTATIACAQDETPPESPATEVATEDTQGTAPEGETPPPATPEPGLLEQVPDDTTIVALNETGEPEPLVTQDVADAIAASDPIWCPAGQVPTPGLNGCTPSFSSFDALLDFLKEHEGEVDYQKAGTIYVEVGAYAGGETSIDFNAYNFTNINNYALSLQGGWDPAGLIVGGSSQFDIPILIGNGVTPWNASVMISNIDIAGVDDQAALTIYATGDVTVTDGEFTDNEVGLDLHAGADVLVEDVQADENSVGGADIVAGGDVIVRSSSFSGNGSITARKQVYGYGLQVQSGGAVTLDEVVADENNLSGATVRAAAAVVVSDSSFSNNKAHTNSSCNGYKAYGSGLQVTTTGGSITLSNVTANGNNLFGANLDASGDVAVTTGSFNNNAFSQSNKVKAGYGLQIVSGGTVSLNGVQANNNSLFGTDIRSAGDVMIVDGVFSGNHSLVCAYGECGNRCTPYGYGLRVVSGGYTALSRVNASGNYLYGASIDSVLGVAIVDGVFDQNAFSQPGMVKGYGLQVVSGGPVALVGIHAGRNNLFGASVQAAGDVAIVRSVFSANQASSGTTAYGYGLQVKTTGQIDLNDVTANDNYVYGADLVADSHVAISGGNFGANVFDPSNKVKTGYGLRIKSGGQVSLVNVQADGNSLYGADVQAASDLSISGGSFSDNRALICINAECGSSSSCAPYGYGLRAVSGGNIAIDHTLANGNYLYGAYLESVGDVALSNSSFSQNAYDLSSKTKTGYGLQVKSGAYVAIYNVQADGNNLFGADVRAGLDIVIVASSFSGNQAYVASSCSGYTALGYGLNATSKAGIYISGVTANDNYLYGANLVADGEVVVDTSAFNANVFDPSTKVKVGYGLNIKSGAAVSLSFVEANGNSLYGTDITAVGDVLVTDSSFSNNKLVICSGYRECGGGSKCTTYGYGIRVVTKGNVRLENVTANANGLYGASLAGVDLTAVNSVFNNNVTDYGLAATASGKVTLTTVTAVNNKTNGATLVNTTGTTVVTNSSFNDNGKVGLSVTTSSDVTLANVAADDNGSHGTYVKGNCCINVYVIDGAYTYNGGYGLKIVNGKLTETGAPVYANNVAGNLYVYGGMCNPPSGNGGSNKPSNCQPSCRDGSHNHCHR